MKISDIAATEKVTDPMPPSPRNISNCVYVCAKPLAIDEAATIAIPRMYIERSPNIFDSRPDAGANTSLMKANADTTMVAAVVVTPKLLAN